MRRILSLILLIAVMLAGCAERTLTVSDTAKISSVAEISEEAQAESDTVSVIPEEYESASSTEPEKNFSSVRTEPSFSESSIYESYAAQSISVPESTSESDAAAMHEKPSESSAPAKSEQEDTAPKQATKSTADEVRGVWISYLEFLNIAKNKTESEFKTSVSDMFATVADFGLNTVFVQVRPFGDALYRSEIFPWSYVLTGEEGVDSGYDPLSIMISVARAENLRIEAWINPYRVRTTGSSRVLAASNPAAKAVNSGDSLAVYYNGGVFYNPASQEARDIITDGVLEIIENYDVDGIHFDDYFYPTTDAEFDADDYADYQSGGGKLSLAAWRRENVTRLIRQVYKAIKNTNSSMVFGISPQARLDVNYNTQYADVETWAREGIVDYLCPQIYFGFEHATQPFGVRADEWESLLSGTGVSLYIGLAAYKCGVTDNYAGESGRDEWTDNTDILAQMVSYSREKSGYGGFVIYRYDSLFNPESAVKSHIAAERKNLDGIL